MLEEIGAGRFGPVYRARDNATGGIFAIKELPDLPTYAQEGYPDLNNGVFYGLLAPAGTPKEIIDKLNKTATEALAAPNVVAALQKQGAIPDPGSPAHFAEEIKKQYDIAKAIVKKGNLQMKRN